MKIPTKGRREEKRDAILSAAKQMFQECGVQNTSMDKLALLAEVSKRTIYNHFESKEAIVMELLSELWQSSMLTKTPEQFSSLPLNEQLVYLLMSEIRVLTAPAYIELAKVAFGHYFYKPEELKAQTDKMSKQETALFRWLSNQSQVGTIATKDIHFASVQLHSLIKGSAFWPQIMGIQDSLTEEQALALAIQTAELFLSHYAVETDYR
jgi:TetR/AcrR family transcriptional regulator, regulator of autoinduction and epiphytic fitness